MKAVRPRMTFTDLERLPEDGPRYELYDGDLSEVPAPIPWHQRVALNVTEVLRDYERRHGGLTLFSPIDIVLDDYNVVQPDVVFFRKARLSGIDMRRAIRIPPDLAAEVLSPTTEQTDRGRKLRLLARFEVKEYWLLDPGERSVEQYLWRNGTLTLEATLPIGVVLTAHTLEGLAAPVDRLFAD
jgi:Uma2 family endonuclease